MAYKGEIRLLALVAEHVPEGWVICDGLSPETPDLRGRLPVHADADLPLGDKRGSELVQLEEPDLPRHRHPIVCGGPATQTTPSDGLWGAVGGEVSAPYASVAAPTSSMAAACLGETGGSAPHDNVMPYMALNYIYALGLGVTDDDAFVGEVRAFAGALPKGWLACDGKLYGMRQYVALAALLKTAFGGNAYQFAVPNLQGLSILGAGEGMGLSSRPFASTGGASTVTLSGDQMPAHSHQPACSDTADAASPGGNIWAADPGQLVQFATTYNDEMYDAVGSVGGSGSHENRQPFLGLTYAICAAGVWPSSSLEEPQS